MKRVLMVVMCGMVIATGADVLALPEGGPVTFHKKTAGPDCVYRFVEPGTYARDVTVVPPAKGPMWYAFESRATSTNGTPVVNEGRIIVPAMKGGHCARIANVGSAPFIQKGAIETGSRLDINGNVTLACPFRFSGTGEALFADGMGGRIQVADGFSFGGEDGLAASFVRLLVSKRQECRFSDGGPQLGEAALMPLHNGVLGKWQSLVAISEKRETINEIVRRLPPAWRARCKVSRNGHRLVVRNVTVADTTSPEVVRKMPDSLPPNRAVVRDDGTATLRILASTPLAQIRDAVRAARVAHPGRPLVVSLAEGVYPVTETVTLSLVDSGTPSAPITWRGEGRGAVFSGAAAIGPWREKPGRAFARPPWRASVPKEADGKPMWAAEFFANGVRRPNAAYPAGGRFIHATNITEKVLAEKFAKYDYSVPAEHTLFLRTEDFAHVAAIPEAELPFVQVRIHSKWNAARHFIVHMDRAACSVTIRGTRWPPWNRYIAAECPIRFENMRTELKMPGEWFYDRAAGEVVYLPTEGEMMDRVEGAIPVDGVDVFLRLVGDINAEEYAGNIRFENIAFRHGSTLNKKGPADVPDSLMLGAVARGMILADGVRNVVFDGCRWEQTGGAYGVWFREGCMSNAVVNCAFRDLGGGAVRVGVNGGIRAVKGLADELEVTGPYPHPFRAYVPHSTAFITVENCLVERGGRYMPGAGAIVVAAASDCRVVHNRIDDLHYTAITCNWDFGYGGSPCQRCLVAFNHISHVGYGDLSDMGGVYMAGSGFGNVVARNVIHGVDGMVYGGWGLYPDEGTEGVLYESNLVYDTKDGGIHQHFGRDNVVRNNIFAFAREGQVAITRAEPHRSWTFEGNIVAWDKGDAFAKYRGTKDEKAIVDWKRNLWWRLDGRPDVFNGKTFAEWQAKGKDVDGLSADPLFVDAAHRDFRFRDTAVAAKIGFKPFDFSRAGLCDRKVQPIYDTSYERQLERENR